MREERKGQRPWGQKEDKDPDWPMQRAVDAGISLPHLALLGILNFSGVTHAKKSRRAIARPSM
jgi:hypothetical protein